MTDWADIIPSTRGIGAVVGTCITAMNTRGQVITVDIGGQQINAVCSRSFGDALYWPVNGDPVLCVKAGSTWYVVEVLGQTTTDLTTFTTDAAPSVRPDYVTGRFVLHPTDTATYRAGVGWRTDTTDLHQGDSNGGGRFTGAAFYGTVPTALAGATVTKAVVQVKRLAAGPYAAAAPTLKLVTETTRPSGAPTLSSSLAGPSLIPDQTAEVDIGTTWGQGLVDGTYGGLAINVAADTPYLRLAGRDSWAAAFVVVIDWRRDG